ncbi:hypothetical protein [Nemorincola caseinilytica]
MRTLDELVAFDNYLWEKLGAEYGFQLERCWNEYKDEVKKNVTQMVSKQVARELKKQNHFFLLQALKELDLLYANE